MAHERLLGSAWNAGLGAQPSLGQTRRTDMLGAEMRPNTGRVT